MDIQPFPTALARFDRVAQFQQTTRSIVALMIQVRRDWIGSPTKVKLIREPDPVALGKLLSD